MAETSVAVIVPAFNAERFLGATLDSLRAQTFRAFETVVIDDGSRDQTADVARRYSEVRLIQQQNSGVAAARNRGIRDTRSEWVAFLDADDLWTSEKLRLQIECGQETGAGAVFCDLRTIDVHGREIPESSSVRVSLDMEPLLLHSDSIPQGTSSTILVRRSVLEAIGGYDESLATMADWDLLIRLRRTTTFGHIPRQLVAYRRYPGTMSRSVVMLERESLVILDKVFRSSDLPEVWRQLERKSRAWNDLVLSGTHFGAGHFGAACRFGFRAIQGDPGLVGRVLAMPVRRMRRFVASALAWR